MKFDIHNNIQKRFFVSNWTLSVIILINIILLAGTFIIFGYYIGDYQNRLRNENLTNVSNLNKSSAMNATSLIKSWNYKLADISQYVDAHNLTYEEGLTFINEVNSSNDHFIQLIDPLTYQGHETKKSDNNTFEIVDYSNDSYQTLKIAIDDVDDNNFTDICFAPEFTEYISGEKCFAIYKHISLKNEVNETKKYAIILAIKSKEVLKSFNSQSDYKGQSTILTNQNGDYIVSNNDFKSTNFFNYLYKYNNLSLDEKLRIQDDFISKDSGSLFYKNASFIVEDCIYRYYKMDTNNWYVITCVPISSFHNTTFNVTYVIIVVILLLGLLVVDILWFQRVNRRLRLSIAREKEANMAKGDFMSRMSHEIRTPLNAVIGYITIAKNEVKEVNNEADYRHSKMKIMDCLSKSSIASKHLLTIINDVLDMSAIESGKIKVENERFDFKGLITSLTTVFYSQLKNKGINFEVIFDKLTEEWYIGDQMRTNQILTNLLSNAVKFTPEGGQVVLTINETAGDTDYPHVHFMVKDTGIGMSEEYLTHIWTPFEQADSSISRRFGGTGLGLAITKNLVDLMGGKISVESKPGEGTTFTVELIYQKTNQPVNKVPYDFKDINALVVDDDIYTCDYIAELFHRCGARCTYALDGESAIHLFEEASKTNTPYTICLIDWQMPHMNGIDTIKQLRQITEDKIPIIVITAYDFTEIREQASELGVKMFINKPLFQSSLFDLLATIGGSNSTKEIMKDDKYHFDNCRVLLAEDNTMNMEIAKQIMESVGIIVDCAWDGHEAVTMFESSTVGTYKMIFMDIHMPVLDGHTATKTIRMSAHPEAKTIPIIAMTADAFSENVAEAYAAGMNDHISKPIDVDILFKTIEKYIK